MKIVHFIGSMEKTAGGTAIYMQLLAAELKEQAEIVIVTANGTDPVELPEIRMINCDFRVLRWFSLKKDFRQIIKEENPDMVHINGIWNPQNWLFQKMAQEMGIKVLISPHGMLEPYILQRNSAKKKLALFLYQRKAINRADFLHATASSEIDQIRSLGFKTPAAVIPNGVDISEIKPRRLRNTHKSFQILFLSRIHPKKGIEVLIEAVSNIDGNLKVTIAGEGEESYIQKLRELLIYKKVEDQFNFIGGVYGAEKWALYGEADVFVLPTYSENFGIVITEALAAGIPVITTTGTPWQDLVTYDCGWWIDLNVLNLEQAIKKAMNKNPAELREMGENGKELVKQRYDIKMVSRETLKMYKKLLVH